MTKQKIIFSVTNDLSFDQRMQRICASLHGAGYDVWLVGRSRRDSIPFQAPYHHHRLPCSFQSGKLFYLEYSIRLWRYFAKHKADAYCAVDLDTALPVLLASARHRRPWIYDAHELFQEVPEVVHRPIVKWLWSRLADYAIPRAALAYTVSESLAAYFSSHYEQKFAVIRNLPRFKSASVSAPTEKFILYQGALNVGRGLELLIDAAPAMDCPVYIAGKGDLAASLREKAAASPAADRIHFLGSLEPAALADWTSRAYLGYNLLANTGLSYYYSLANKFFDYTMAGVPCLVSPFPEYEALRERYGIGIPAELEVEQLVGIVNNLLNDEGRHSLLKQQAFKAAAELNWEKEEQKLLQLYHQLFAESPREDTLE